MYRTGVIHREVRGAHHGAFGLVPQPEVYTRAVHRGVSGPDHIRSCVTLVGHLAWTVKVQTTQGHVGSKYFFTSFNFLVIFQTLLTFPRVLSKYDDDKRMSDKIPCRE